MKPFHHVFLAIITPLLFAGCQSPGGKASESGTENRDTAGTADTINREGEENYGYTPAADASDSAAVYGTNIRLARPEVTEKNTVRNEGQAIGWKDGERPLAPEGFTITRFAKDLNHPRWLHFTPNGDVLVAESNDAGNSGNRILYLRDNDYDGKSDLKGVFLNNLNQPFGMLILDTAFYVANQNGLWRYPYQSNQQKITAPGKKILDLPAGGYNHHWTRNIIGSEDGKKIYVAVGSASNVGEYGMDEEIRRANILQINPDGSGEKIYASGLRNPVGMDWNPTTGALWTAVNERDKLGNNIVPDYITSVKEDAFYGWPYAYWGQNEDPRRKGEAPDMVDKSIKPDYAVGAHTASLGLAFYDKDMFPAKYRNGVFVAQHGSWNRSVMNGYTVLFIPFTAGKPSGEPEKFLTGFIQSMGKAKVHGRPVGVFVAPDGSMYITDDDGGSIWKVTYGK